MSRLEGKKPDVGAIIIGAIIFSLVAAGLFFAFRPVPEPTDAGLSNAASAANEKGEGASSDTNAAGDNATEGENTNSLTTILTPLPMATPTVAPQAPPTEAVTSPNDNSAPAPIAATAPVAAVEETAPITPAATNMALTPNAP